MFYLVPRAWKLGCRGYGLASCKPVYPFPLRCSALPGAWDVPPRGHTGFDVWAVDLVKFRLGFFPKFGFGVFSDVLHGSVLARMLLVVLHLSFNPLNAGLNPICHLLALLGVHHFLHVSRIRVKSLTLRLLMSHTHTHTHTHTHIYIYIWSTHS